MPAAMRAPIVLVGLAACQTASAPAERAITLRGDGDGVTLVRTAEGCRADDVAIRVHDGEAHGGGWHLTPAAASRALALRDAPMARMIPISRVRSSTARLMVDASPRPPMSIVSWDIASRNPETISRWSSMDCRFAWMRSALATCIPADS